MKNTLWRFGDSWSLTQNDKFKHIELNHSYYVAEHYGLELKHYGRGGYGNLQIFNEIIKQDSNYKKGDIILINFASRMRTVVVNEKSIISTSDADDKVFSNKILQDIVINNLEYPIQDMIFFLIKPYFKSLLNRGIDVYHFYNDETDNIYGIDNRLNFDNLNYIQWCIQNNYQDLSPSGNVHYKLGCQKEIANKIIELIESL
jgi:hypothetical protein